MTRLLTWLILGLAVYFLVTSGLGTAILNGNTPVPGAQAEAVGPKDGYIYFSPNQAEMRWPIDALIGFGSRDRRPAQTILASKIDAGSITVLPDHCKIKILENGKLYVYSCAYKIVKVQVLNGPNRGAKGWVLREDVADNLLQQFIQNNFRSGAASFNKEVNSVDFKAKPSKYDF